MRCENVVFFKKDFREAMSLRNSLVSFIAKTKRKCSGMLNTHWDSQNCGESMGNIWEGKWCRDCPIFKVALSREHGKFEVLEGLESSKGNMVGLRRL